MSLFPPEGTGLTVCPGDAGSGCQPGPWNLKRLPSCHKPLYLPRMASGEVQGLNQASCDPEAWVAHADTLKCLSVETMALLCHGAVLLPSPSVTGKPPSLNSQCHTVAEPPRPPGPQALLTGPSEAVRWDITQRWNCREQKEKCGSSGSPVRDVGALETEWQVH